MSNTKIMFLALYALGSGVFSAMGFYAVARWGWPAGVAPFGGAGLCAAMVWVVSEDPFL